MSEDYFDRFEPEKNAAEPELNEQKPFEVAPVQPEQPIEAAPIQPEQPIEAAPIQPEPQVDAAPVEPEQVADFTPQNPEPEQNAQPAYTNPYASAYRSPDPVRPAYTERSASYSAPKTSYDDGFYHHSFTQNSAGTNVNYTRPAAPTYPAHTQPPVRERKQKSGGMSKGVVAFLLILCVLLSGAAGFGGSLLANNLNKQEYSSSGEAMVIHKVSAEAETATEAALVDKTTSEITKEVADTVVEITTETMQTSSFYGQYIAQGAGSGVIISDDGYIITNNHVIEDATSIKVTTRSGDSYDATLVGADSEVDIALLKIDATDLPTAVFGDSSTLSVGDKAVIIGNPLGTLGGSVTEGIISALDRTIAIDGKTMHLMQTDAAINPGNSGGGMFNGQGELAGIVVAKSSSNEIDNIGFVIPINNVLDILGDLKDYGYVRGRADTGMTFIDLTNQMYAWYYYGNSNAGVYISSVESGSNAYEAGFREGDRVIAVDGVEVGSVDDIENAISGKSAGDVVSFSLERGSSKGTIDLELEEKVPDSVKQKNNQSDNGFGFDGGNFFNR